MAITAGWLVKSVVSQYLPWYHEAKLESAADVLRGAPSVEAGISDKRRKSGDS
jgi:hypothetical protein